MPVFFVYKINQFFKKEILNRFSTTVETPLISFAEKPKKKRNKKGRHSNDPSVHLYLCPQLNYRLVTDCTNLGKNGELLLFVDLSCRTIVGHSYSSTKFTAKKVIELASEVIKKRSIVGKLNWFFMDNGNEFKNVDMRALCAKFDVAIEHTDPGELQNNVMESINASVKLRIRVHFNPAYERKKKGIPRSEDPLTEVIPIEALENAILIAIEAYNNDESTLVKGVSRNGLENALFEQSVPVGVPMLSKNDESVGALAIYKHFNDCVELETNNQLEFLQQTDLPSLNLDLTPFEAASLRLSALTFNETQRLTQELQTMAIEIEHRDQQILEIQLENQTKLAENHIQYESKLEQAIQSLRNLEASNQAREDEALKIRIAKERRKNRKKMPIRQIITPDEYNSLLLLIKTKNPYIRARLVCTYSLLFMTGVRISQLLTLKVADINSLIEKGEVAVEAIKNGPPRFLIVFSRAQQEFFKNARVEVDVLSERKELGDFFMTAKKNSKRPLNVSNFNTEVNEPLKRLSKLLGKFIRSHSFRATAITDLLATEKLEHVSRVIGHKSVKTTVEYNRSLLNTRDIKSILQSRTLRSRRAVRDLSDNKEKKDKKKLAKSKDDAAKELGD